MPAGAFAVIPGAVVLASQVDTGGNTGERVALAVATVLMAVALIDFDWRRGRHGAPWLLFAISAAAGTLEDSEVAQAAEHDTRLGDTVGLSPRETDVLRLVVLGFSNQEIAGELYVSVNSVKTYIRSAYRKIGVTTRPQVVSWCVRHGFPPPND